ncbi:hypothetical protein GH733_010918 [Mirounga leonina]|nr:hypothetical protein GH733_010918 [Mirounga leonina]
MHLFPLLPGAFYSCIIPAKEGTAAKLPGMASEVENQEASSSLKPRKCFKNMIICAMCANGKYGGFYTVSTKLLQWCRIRRSCDVGVGGFILVTLGCWPAFPVVVLTRGTAHGLSLSSTCPETFLWILII